MGLFIINADDYGISDRFDDAIIDLVEKGYLSSISIIVRNVSQKSIDKIIPYFSQISPGLHFEYTQKVDGDDEYSKIKEALELQYQRFFEIFGIYPTHLDKHNREKTANEIKAMCDFSIEKKIPIRLYTRGKLFGTFENNYQDKIKLTDFLYNIGAEKYGIGKIRDDINKGVGQDQIFEVICHPGFFDSEYNNELNGTDMNEKRVADYQKIIELGKLLQKTQQKIVSFNIMGKKA